MKEVVSSSPITRTVDGARNLSIKALFAVAGIMSSVSPAFADLPTSDAPTRGNGSGFIETFKNYGYDIGILLGLLLATCAFLVVGHHSIGSYAQVQAGRKTWGDFGATVAVGALILVLVVWLCTQAATIL
ncbi:TIGR03745 family integrating conjugative element membrane protein [Pseudomonas caricapapayae]|uniref:TIGR03745 family integrating conjugative element membrane protein n=1 Tax=Pseudomonas caricapapayae TaxID=46678 RepID=UPI000EFE6FA5|nr:TIGR03745 family integrating conjugative element membrane protein [Pseudomonas caricapapayae]